VIQRARRQFARGHTLLEMTLSLALLSMVMMSVGSAVLFASSVTPKESDPGVTLAVDSRALNQIAEDLAVARYMVSKSDHSVSFIVSDRTGDGNPDRITYAWSGTYGDPLTYQLNNNNTIKLISAVAVFDLSYDYTQTSKTLPVATSLGSEKTIDAYTTSTSGSTRAVRPMEWFGQVVTPALSVEAIGFVPTKLKFIGQRDSTSDGIALFELRDRTSASPGSTVYASSTILESALSSSRAWYETSFADAGAVASGQDLALMFSYKSGTDQVSYLAEESVSGGLLGLGGDKGGLLESSNGGSTWSLDDSKTFVYQLMGRELIADSQQHTVNQSCLTQTTIKLQSAAASRSPLLRKAFMALAPKSLDTFAETEFDGDPTSVDLNNDGAAEWQHSNIFVKESLNGGLWTCDGRLTFNPDGLSEAGVITVKARMQSNDTLGPAIYGPYAIDSGGQLLPLITQLRSDGAGGQELVVYNDLEMRTAILIIPDLPGGQVDVQLTVLPHEHTVSIEVMHKAVGSILLSHADNPGNLDLGISIGTTGGVAQFSSVSVQVGGTYSTQASDTGGLLSETLNLLLK